MRIRCSVVRERASYRLASVSLRTCILPPTLDPNIHTWGGRLRRSRAHQGAAGMPVQCTGPCSCEQQTLHLQQCTAVCQGYWTVVLFPLLGWQAAPAWAAQRVTAWCRFAWIQCKPRQLTSKHQPTASSLDQNAIVKLSPEGAPCQPCTQRVDVQPCTAHPLCRPHSRCSGGVRLE